MEIFDQNGAQIYAASYSYTGSTIAVGSNGKSYIQNIAGDNKWYEILVKNVGGTIQLSIDESTPLDSPDAGNLIQVGSDGKSYIKNEVDGKYYEILVKNVGGTIQIGIDESTPLDTVP